MSFGRRLAVFFVLIVLVPTLALVGMLILVSEDSRQGKADARLSAGLDTAAALYDESVSAAEPKARALAADPALGEGLRSGDADALTRFARAAAAEPGVAGVEVLGPAGNIEAAGGRRRCDRVRAARPGRAGDATRRAAGLGDDRAGVCDGAQAPDQARAGGQQGRCTRGRNGRAGGSGPRAGGDGGHRARPGRIPGAPPEPERRARGVAVAAGPAQGRGPAGYRATGGRAACRLPAAGDRARVGAGPRDDRAALPGGRSRPSRTRSPGSPTAGGWTSCWAGRSSARSDSGTSSPC